MKINKDSSLPAQAGQTSRLLLVLAVIVFVAVVITFLVMRMAEKPPAPPPQNIDTVQLPIYEQQLGDIRFIFESSLDKGNILKASDIKNTQFSSYKKDLSVSNTGAKFVQVTIGAQNMGTENTVNRAWDIENIVDSKGREFVPLSGSLVNPWLPYPDLCGALLKPAFDPTPCTKIYEVSKISTGLKIRVKTGKNNTGATSKDAQSFLIDLIIK
jgi:hypothetical protein